MRLLLLTGLFLFWGCQSLSRRQDDADNVVHVVVLGSSTAEGAGPVSRDSAWVNRYRSYLKSLDSANRVTNLGVGGTTTYHIMPAWYRTPEGRPAVNPGQNISKAISLGADVIIINMPSNDAANYFTAEEQMKNFRLLKAVADSAGIHLWICTPQPRNFRDSIQTALQVETRDRIEKEYGKRFLDFWTAVADEHDHIKPEMGSGDGVHLNSDGHRELYKVVKEAHIPAVIHNSENLSNTH